MRKALINMLGKTINGLEKRSNAKRKSVVPGRKRAYSAAQVGRLFSSWSTTTVDINEELKVALRPIRARSRDLVKNNVFARKFMHMVGNNVVGPKGAVYQAKVKTKKGATDVAVNRVLEAAWRDFGKRRNCSVCGTLSWLNIQNIFVKTVARDGECLIRKIRNKRFKYGFALQFIDVDYLDETYHEAELPNGNRVVLGIEYDTWGRPAAYHIRKRTEGMNGWVHGERERVPADEIIHGFVSEHPNQARAVSWLSVGATDVKMLDGYKESTVVSARVGAAKMGFLYTPTGNEYHGDENKSDGNVIDEIEPGLIEQLPAGWEFKEFNPKQNAGDLDPFMTKEVQGIASGWNVSYTSLANDQKGTSYSADRSARIEERDSWMVIQEELLIETLCENIHEEFVDLGILSGAIPLSYTRIDSLMAHKFQAKRWKWIDPLKDENANTKALANRTTSRTRIAAEGGNDIEEILDELAWEEAEIADRIDKFKEAVTNGKKQ